MVEAVKFGSLADRSRHSSADRIPVSEKLPRGSAGYSQRGARSQPICECCNGEGTLDGENPCTFCPESKGGNDDE